MAKDNALQFLWEYLGEGRNFTEIGERHKVSASYVGRVVNTGLDVIRATKRKALAKLVGKKLTEGKKEGAR